MTATICECGASLGPRNRTGLCTKCYQAKWQKDNSKQVLANTKAWQERNPDKVKSAKLKYAHGITLEQYNEMYLAQQGCCPICNTWYAVLHVDHDHSCCDFPRPTSKQSCGKCIRELLCMNCNNGLGSFRDDPLALARAQVYLAKHQRSWYTSLNTDFKETND